MRQSLIKMPRHKSLEKRNVLKPIKKCQYTSWRVRFPHLSDTMIQYCLIWISWFSIVWFGSPDLVFFDSEWLIRYCVCNCYILTLHWNSWRHRCVQSTNLLTPIEIHWAQWSCSCYTSLLRSPGHSLLECRDAWHVLGALLLGCSKMQGCQPIYANGYFTTRTVSLRTSQTLGDRS